MKDPSVNGQAPTTPEKKIAGPGGVCRAGFVDAAASVIDEDHFRSDHLRPA